MLFMKSAATTPRNPSAIAAQPKPEDELRKAEAEQRKLFSAKANDYDSVRKSIEDGSGHVRGLWITHVLFGIYLLIATGSVTHRQLFLSEPIKLPLLDVQLPLVAFFVVGPAFFTVFHLYLLLQIGVLRGKVDGFGRLISSVFPDDCSRPRKVRETKTLKIERELRRQLPNDVLVRSRAGPDDESLVYGGTMRLVTVATTVIGPAIVLLFIQKSFLPYQNEWVTWWQRGCVIADVLGMLVLFWPSAAAKPRQSLAIPGGALLATSVVTVSCFVLTFPCETLDYSWPAQSFHSWARWELRPEGPKAEDEISKHSKLRQRLYWVESRAEGERDWLDRTPEALRFVAGNLRLSGETLIDLDTLQKVEEREQKREPKPGIRDSQRLLSIGSRNFVFADFGFADLRRADFRSANMQRSFFGQVRLELTWLDRADLTGARLPGAQIQRSSLAATVLREAVLDRAQLAGSIMSAAQLKGASLRNSDLQNAALDSVDLREASFYQSNLKDASIRGADLRNATFSEAVLSGAALDGTDLRNASFNQTSLDGTTLDDIKAQETEFFDASLRGAILDNARLQNARVRSSSLQGASIENADLQGAKFVDANLDGSTLDDSQLAGAIFVSSTLRGASLIRASLVTASFQSVHLQGASFSEADLRAAIFDRAEIQGTSFTGSNLHGTSFKDSRAYRTDFDGADLGLASGIIVYSDRLQNEINQYFSNTDDYRILNRNRIIDQNMINQWKEGATEFVKADVNKQNIRDRFRILETGKAPPKEIRIPSTLNEDMLNRYIAYVSALACARENAPSIARGVVRNGMIAGIGPEGREIARKLWAGRDDLSDCPGVAGFVDSDWLALERLAPPPPGRERIRPSPAPPQYDAPPLKWDVGRRTN